jgi:hypothetical protein
MVEAESIDGASLTASMDILTSALEVLSPWVMVYVKVSAPLKSAFGV